MIKVIEEESKTIWNVNQSKKTRITQSIIGLIIMVTMSYFYQYSMKLPSSKFNEFFGKYAIAFTLLMGILIGYILLLSIFNLEHKTVKATVFGITLLVIGILIGANFVESFKTMLVIVIGIVVAVLCSIFAKGLVTTLILSISIYMSFYFSIFAYALLNVFVSKAKFEAVLYVVLVLTFLLIRKFGCRINNVMIKAITGSSLQLTDIDFKSHLRVSGVIIYIVAVTIRYTLSNVVAFEILNESCITFFMIVEFFGKDFSVNID